MTPSFNQGEFIEQTIRSVLLQGYPNLEYIVIDGASNDKTLDIIRKYERWIDRWVSEPDQGATNALCKGFAKATGELFGIMCADDFYMPGGILKLIELRLSQPNSVAWVGACPEVDLEGNIVNDGLPFIRKLEDIGDWGVGGWFVSVACLFDANSFRSVGRCDERFVTGNDVDLWGKLAKVGSFALTNDLVATARLNPLSLSHRDRSSELSAWITSNYLNGYREVAKRILLRYGQEQAARAVGLISADNVVRSMGCRALTKALIHRFGGAIKRRIQRALCWRLV